MANENISFLHCQISGPLPLKQCFYYFLIWKNVLIICVSQVEEDSPSLLTVYSCIISFTTAPAYFIHYGSCHIVLLPMNSCLITQDWAGNQTSVNVSLTGLRLGCCRNQYYYAQWVLLQSLCVGPERKPNRPNNTLDKVQWSGSSIFSINGNRSV